MALLESIDCYAVREVPRVVEALDALRQIRTKIAPTLLAERVHRLT